MSHLPSVPLGILLYILLLFNIFFTYSFMKTNWTCQLFFSEKAVISARVQFSGKNPDKNNHFYGVSQRRILKPSFFLKRDSKTGVFLWILQTFKPEEHLQRAGSVLWFSMLVNFYCTHRFLSYTYGENFSVHFNYNAPWQR